MTDYNEANFNALINSAKGTSIVSARNAQPGKISHIKLDPWYKGKDYVEVEWDFHPGKTRTYYRDPIYNDENYFGLPTIVEVEREPTNEELTNMLGEFDNRHTLTFVDTFAGMRESAKEALVNSLVEDPTGNPSVDINKFLAALTDLGWVFQGKAD